jgi:DegV family protein with EDD domain
VGSARLAASRAGVPVHVVDSGTVGMGLGFAALAAARAADSLTRRPAQEQVGGFGEIVRDAARTAAEHASVLFAVDSLEHLRRGGRLGPVAAALGSVLGLHPLLQVRGGRLEVVEKVRTTRRARERLIERSVADAVARRGCDLAVHHLGQPALAEQLADQLWASCGPRVRTVHVVEVSAVLGAHVGPGVLCVVVADV